MTDDVPVGTLLDRSEVPLLISPGTDYHPEYNPPPELHASAEVERAVLGGILNQRTDSSFLFDSVTDEMFFHEPLRDIYAALKKQHGTGKPLEPIVFMHSFRVVHPDAAGLIADLLEYDTDALPDVVALLVQLYQRRTANWILHKGLTDLNGPVRSVAIQTVIAELSDVVEYDGPPASDMTVAEAVDAAFADLEMRYQHGSNITGFCTGLHQFDEITEGFKRGELSVVCGRPSSGKTAFMLQIARDAATNGTPTLFVSLEMTKPRLVQRLVCAEAVTTLRALTSQVGHDMDFQRYSEVSRALATEWPLEIDATGYTVNGILRALDRAEAKIGEPIQLLLIDYLTKMTVPDADRRDLAIGDLTNSIHKRLALGRNVAVVLGAQLSRANVRDGVRHPRLSDLRDSGNIEQDADEVVALHPTGDGGEHAEDGKLLLLCLKNRNGPTGNIHVQFERDTQRFREWTHQYPEKDYDGERQHKD